MFSDIVRLIVAFYMCVVNVLHCAVNFRIVYTDNNDHSTLWSVWSGGQTLNMLSCIARSNWWSWSIAHYGENVDLIYSCYKDHMVTSVTFAKKPLATVKPDKCTIASCHLLWQYVTVNDCYRCNNRRSSLLSWIVNCMFPTWDCYIRGKLENAEAVK